MAEIEKLLTPITEWFGLPGGADDFTPEDISDDLDIAQFLSLLRLKGLKGKIKKFPRFTKPVRLRTPLLLLSKGSAGSDSQEEGNVKNADTDVLGLLPPLLGDREWQLLGIDGQLVKKGPFRTLWNFVVAKGILPYGIECYSDREITDGTEERLNPVAHGKRGWFWGAMWRQRKDLLQVVPASLMINAFALAMPLFIMNVYDRVVPNEAFDTLWVLAIGVAIVFSFEFLIRLLRGAFVDRAGKGADESLSDQIYDQTLNIDLSARPASAGNFAAQTRGYESVRDFFSSATLVGLLDFPFALLMFGLVFWIGGDVGWIPVIATTAVLLFVLLLQPFLARSARASHEDRVNRQTLVTETANGLESIKAIDSAAHLRKRMAKIVDDSSDIDLRTRKLTQMGTSFTALAIHITTVAVIVLGTYLISERQLSMGGLIACVMIVGRGMAPLNQISNLLLRMQGVRAALRGLDGIMSLKRDDGNQLLKKRIHFPTIQLAQATFQYKDQPSPALLDFVATIKPGERIGLIGRAGSGKTTLLRLLSRQLGATQGLVMFDGVDISQLHPASVRRCSGYLPQDGLVFCGSIKDNIQLGRTNFSDDQLLHAARLGGVLSWANQHPQGLDMEVGERGVLVSGGQRQTILLARTLLAQPDVLLLDEPTASLDLVSERYFGKVIEGYLRAEEKRTLILATHKLSLLSLVDRVIVLERGNKIQDGPRDEIISKLSAERPPDSESIAKSSAPKSEGKERDEQL